MVKHTQEFIKKHKMLLKEREIQRKIREEEKKLKRELAYKRKLEKKRRKYKDIKDNQPDKYCDIQKKQGGYRLKRKIDKLKKREEKIKSILDGKNYGIYKTKSGFIYYITDQGDAYNQYGRKISTKPSKNGYVQFSNGKMLHQIVWETFMGEIPEGLEIDHINTNRADNRLCNLRILTHPQNCNNPNTLKNYSIGNTTGHCKTVIQIYPDGTEKEWISASEAGRNGYSKVAISMCCRGIIKSHKGFCWKFKK